MPAVASPSSATDTTRSLGQFGETYAAHWLGRRGYAVLDRNVRFSSGEIDIVARDGRELVFIEVKTRRSVRHALPEDSISDERISHLEGAIDEYLDQADDAAPPYRIEVIAIEVDPSGHVSRCEVVRDIGLR